MFCIHIVMLQYHTTFAEIISQGSNNSILSTKILVCSQLIGLTTILLAEYIEATTIPPPPPPPKKKELIISKPPGDNKDNCNLWSCQKMCDALHYFLDNIFIRFGSKLYRQIVGIPMGTNCAPLVADLFLFCYERDFMLSLSDNNQVNIIEAFNSTSRYLDDFLYIDNPYFEHMVGQIYPTELQLNKANSSDTEAPFLDLNLSITNGIVSSKIYDKRDDFNFEIVNFPFPDGDVPRSPSYGVYISQLIRFTRVCSNVNDFNNRNLFLTAKLLKQGYRYHKIRKVFSKFYYRHSELIVKYNIGLKTLLQ